MNPDVDITRQVLIEKAPFFIQLFPRNTGWWYGGTGFVGELFEVEIGSNNILKNRQDRGHYTGHIRDGCYVIVSGPFTRSLISKRDAIRVK